MLHEAFRHFCSGWNQADAGDFSARFLWEVEGAGAWMVAIKDGRCSVLTGQTEDPTCTIRASAEVLTRIFEGELDATAAFLTGAAVADNYRELMQLAALLDFDRIRAAVGGKKSGALSLDDWHEVGTFEVTQSAVQAFARATSDPNPIYYGPTAICPPMFHVRYLVEAFFSLAGRLHVDLSRFFHAGHAADFHRILKVGDRVAVRVRLESVEPKETGKLYHFGFEERLGAELAVSGRSSFFLKERGEVGSASERALRPDPDYISMQMVDLDHADRYAAASGDFNPLHVNPSAARAAGLPGVILHGLCTLAFAQRDLVDETMARDPRRLAHLSVRFAAPVFPGQTLKLAFWYEPNKAVSFETRSWDDRQVALLDGLARLH